MISIACMANLSVSGGIVGAVLFSTGMIGVLLLDLDLFTGKVGFAKTRIEVMRLIPMLAINLITAYICGLIYSFNYGVIQSVQSRFSQGTLMTLYKSVLCGILIYVCVYGFRKSSSISSIVFPISAFVICGGEHCVADAFYAGAGQCLDINVVIVIAMIAVGNSIGSLLLRLKDITYRKSDKSIE